MRIALFTIAALLLSGCGEPASKWDERSGRYRSTSELDAERRNDQRDLDCRVYKLETGREDCIP